MAASVHLSRAQFVRRFRAQFVIAVRLDPARQLLLETNLTLDQIAVALGYGNAQFLARQFKRVYAQMPRQWRKESTRTRQGHPLSENTALGHTAHTHVLK